ncbi:MAG: hypothetical protein E7576_07945 [Ruminococcaceae bacterium]|nr:hypothetical protein [Oscillospiraceae bacterium]
MATKDFGDLSASWKSIDDSIWPILYSPYNAYSGYTRGSTGNLKLRVIGNTLEYEATFKTLSRYNSGQGTTDYTHFLRSLYMVYPGGNVTISNPGSRYILQSDDTETVTGSVTVSGYGKVTVRPNMLYDGVWSEENLAYEEYEGWIPRPAPTIGITFPAGRVEAGRTASLNVTASSDVTSGTVTRYYRASSSDPWQIKDIKSNVKTNQTVSDSIPSDWVGYQVKWRYTASNGTETYKETSVYTVEVYDDSTASISLLSSTFYEGGKVTVQCSNTGTVKSGVVSRYYQAKGSNSWTVTQIAINVTARSTNIEDTIPENTGGGTIYWKYEVNDGRKSAETAQKAITANSPPTTPPSLTIPSAITAGQNFTVSWGSSTDVDNNLSGYVLQRSINQGASWDTIYQGPATSFTDKLLLNQAATVRYRVNAYDSFGATSDYIYAPSSGDRTVTNNHAPTTPAAPITVTPATLTSGITAIISWGTSTDEDGDSFNYVLERAVDGSKSFTKIYEGTAQQFTETVGNWETVTYRVKAVDSKNASSAYRTADAKAVSQNAVPTITCANEDGADLGTKSEVFSFTYSVNDTNASDTLTVKEMVDGVVKKTINNAVRNQNYTFNFRTGSAASTTYWNKILNGSHTITISVSDGTRTVSKSFTFLKSVGACLITMAEAITANKNIDKAVVSICGNIPAGGLTAVQVTADDGTHWEDCILASGTGVTESGIGNRKKMATGALTEELLGGHYLFIHTMANTGKKFNFRVQAQKVGENGGHISSVQGTFTEVNT